MELPRIVVVLLAIIWVACFACFVVVGSLAFISGTTFEYRLFDIQFPYVAFALLASMATCSGLLWGNYKGQEFRWAEKLIYGALFGLSAFGLMLSSILALLA